MLFHSGVKHEDLVLLNRLGVCMSPDAAIRVQRKIGEQLDFPKKPSSDSRELTNRRLSHDAVAGSRHISAFCRNLNLRFVVKTTTLVRAAANFPAVSEVCFLLFTSKLVCSTRICLNS